MKVTELPSEVLLTVLQYCPGQDIITFFEALPTDRISRVVQDASLWRRAIIGPRNPRKCIKYLGKHTKSIKILGFVRLQKKAKPSKHLYSPSEHLSQSLIESIRLRCPVLNQLELQNCVLDTQVIKLSLFPRSLERLTLANVYLLNLPLVRVAVTASPFYNLKKNLPKLKFLQLKNPWFLKPCDSLAIMHSSRKHPDFKKVNQEYTFNFEEGVENMSRDDRRQASLRMLIGIDSK